MVGREVGRERELRGKYWHGEMVGGTVELVLSLCLFAPEEMSKDPNAHT